MIRIAIAITFLLALASVKADSPHFQYATSSLNPKWCLSVDFKEAGLGNSGFSSVIETLTANVTITELCINGGGNHPQAANKRQISFEVSNSGTFPIRNGQTTGTLGACPPPTSRFCPNGQRQEVGQVEWSGITVSDPWGNSIAASPARFCYLAPGFEEYIPQWLTGC